MADFEAIFELDDTDKIDCIFDINATVYNYEELDKLPQINGETLIGNKTSEELHLGSKEDVERLEQNIQNEATTRAENDTLLQNNINTLDEKVDGINVNLTAQIDNLEQDVNTKYNELVNDIDEEIQAREQADNTINQRITDVADELNQTIEENVVALQQEDTALQNQINTHSQTLTAYDTRITNNTNAITQEIADRQAGDNTLQEQVNDNKNLIDTKQDIISDLSTIRSNAQAGYNIIPQVESNTQRIEDLTVARFPNAIIVGTPHIEGGQVSGFSDSNYLQFPFVDISRGLPFDIYFSFTTSSDVNTQQNILDAYFGIALAIQNGKGIMALSSNGTSWDIGTSTGTNTLLPNTTYYVKYSWTGTAYNAALSTDDQIYIPDMNLTSSLSPHKTTIFIGGSPNLFGAGSAHPFKGTINFNKSKVVVNGITVWEGMADVGLASRANVSLTNLDEVGENRFNEKQNVTDNNLVTLDKTVVGAVNELDAKIKDIQLFKFPDATIIGTPTINNGQVTNFSSNNYLILPFAFDTKDRAFEINMAFTTGSNVSTTQNLLGGNYCIALLIEGGKLVFRASNNGTSWNVVDITTSLTLQPSTNYFVRIYFDKLSYKISYSTNGEDYTQVGYKITTETPRHGQVFIGVGNNQHNPFLGIINLNRCNIKLNTSIIWQGMDDAGLATRADISLSNLDEIGQAKFDAKQDKLTAGSAIGIDNNEVAVKLFDKSKFTVVGSPTITDDGVASGFSNGNYLRVQLPTVNTPQTTTTIVDIYGSFSLTSIPNAYQYILGAEVQNQTRPDCFINQEGKIGFSLYGAPELFSNEVMPLNTRIKFHFKLNSERNWVVEYKIGDNDWVTLGTLVWGTGQSITLEGYVRLGDHELNGSSPFTNGSIDLKQFSITADGVEVFNGTQTIYQALEEKSPLIYNAQAFSVIGSPTITDDGIVSMSSNYKGVSVSYLWDVSKSWEFEFEWQMGDTARSKIVEQILQHYGVNSGEWTCQLGWMDTDSSMFFNLSDGADEGNIARMTLNCPLITNSNYKFVIGFNGSNTYYLKGYRDGILADATTHTSTTLINSRVPFFNFYYANEVHNENKGFLNAKSVTLKVDGVEVFSGALKGTKQLTTAGFPSDKYIDLTLGASGATYTMPADGWLNIVQTTNVNNSGFCTVEIWDENGILAKYCVSSPNNTNHQGGMFPIKKNNYIKIFYDRTTFDKLRFIYAEGAK